MTLWAQIGLRFAGPVLLAQFVFAVRERPAGSKRSPPLASNSSKIISSRRAGHHCPYAPSRSLGKEALESYIAREAVRPVTCRVRRSLIQRPRYVPGHQQDDSRQRDEEHLQKLLQPAFESLHPTPERKSRGHRGATANPKAGCFAARLKIVVRESSRAKLHASTLGQQSPL